MRTAAYDYALVGGLNGLPDHAVSPERYSVVSRDIVAAINQLSSDTVVATTGRAGPIRERVLEVADELALLGRELATYSGSDDTAALARVVTRVGEGWRQLTDLGQILPPDQQLADALQRGTSIAVGVQSERRFTVTVGPYATRADAEAVARVIGQVEGVTESAPFVVRVGTFPDRAAAEAAQAGLVPKGFSISAISEDERHVFSRSGPAPEAELWREPTRVFSTHGDARRVAISTGGAWLATGSDDGTVAIFSGQGVLRALPKFNAGVAHLIFSDDGAWLFAGGLTLATLRVPLGSANGETVRLPTPATQAVFVPGARAFVASSEGPTGQPPGGPGALAARAPDGAPLGPPFPLGTPAAGSVLATSDLGELFIATPANVGGATDVEVLRLGAEQTPRGIVRVPGTIRALRVERGGTRAAAITETGLYRFGPKDGDPTGSMRLVGPAPRDAAFGPDGTLFVLEPTRLSFYGADLRPLFSVPLTDGRRLLVGNRAIVLDGTERVIAVDPRTGSVDEIGTGGGAIQDLALSLDGDRVVVLAEGRRAVLFTLP